MMVVWLQIKKGVFFQTESLGMFTLERSCLTRFVGQEQQQMPEELGRKTSWEGYTMHQSLFILRCNCSSSFSNVICIF